MISSDILARIDQRGPDECWEWTGPRDHSGYGVTHVPGARVPGRVSRLVLAQSLGRVLKAGEMACHHCDNPPCCNPAHLYAGTAKQNMADAVARGRIATGNRQGMHTHPENRPVGDKNPMRRPGVAARQQANRTPVSQAGSLNNAARLSEADVPVIRSRAADGERFAAIARDYGVSDQSISNIVHRRKWGHVP